MSCILAKSIGNVQFQTNRKRAQEGAEEAVTEARRPVYRASAHTGFSNRHRRRSNHLRHFYQQHRRRCRMGDGLATEGLSEILRRVRNTGRSGARP